MVWTLGEIAEMAEGRVERGDLTTPIDDISVDTRQVMAPNTLFVALEGPRFDGHDFIEDAAASSAAAVMVADGQAVGDVDLAVIVVDNTLEALQQFARNWRGQLSMPVVGITGSNGKTIVKDMLASILGRANTVYRSPGSYNSQVGVPLALLGMRREHDLAIVEAGISQTGEMMRLERMIRPTCGIVTNIGLAHAAGLGDEETTAEEKRKLFERTEGPVAVPCDEPLLSEEMFHVKRIPFAGADGPTRPGPDCAVAVDEVKSRDGGFDVRLQLRCGEGVDVALNVPGRHNVANAAAAAAIAAELGASSDDIANGLGAYTLAKMRLQMHTTGADVTLINDTYNADPTSMRAALGVLETYAGQQRTIAILGDMLDLGDRARQAHRRVGQHLARLDVDRLYCVGELAAHIGEAVREEGMDPQAVICVQDYEALNPLLDKQLRPGDVVLFKASRAVGLERAARRLIESVAPTRLYVDLEAIGDNFHAIRHHLGDEVKVMAVVKSFGYGNDATRVSQTLVQQGVDALAVAYPDEAIPLRNRGLTLPVMVMNARAEEADKLVKYQLQPLVYTRNVARALARQAKARATTVDIHLAVDTGMRRAGLRPHNVVNFAEEITNLDSLRIQGIMTHFAAADDPCQDRFTRRQIDQFEHVIEQLQQRGVDVPTVHAANTAAAWRFPEARYDMIRVGLGIYGLHPSEAVESTTGTAVRPALKMTTRVLHLQQIQPGETVGYGRTWTADQPRRLATIAAGYNDGVPYFLSNRGEVLINGVRCQVVGSVCMDVTVVDVTDAGEVQVGDEVVLFGRQDDDFIHIDEWARMGETINYELLCNVSSRVRRIFIRS